MKTVLVADDEPALREVVSEVLREEGYGVLQARNGREAVDLFALVRPDLVLMDVMMPVMDGRMAYLAMRSHADLASIPVIMMSASVSPDRLDPSIAAYLPKPFDIDHLLALIARFIRA
ncbi:MAG: response regulator [Thermomicrobiales bacterium]